MLFYIFIFFIPVAVWLILQIVSKRNGEEQKQPFLEVCSLCHEEFPTDELLEKEVGEYSRVYCFCGNCIDKLYHEYHAKTEGEGVLGDREKEAESGEHPLT